jgi:hypothetical protein
LTVDVIENDPITYVVGEAQALLLDSYMQCQKVNDELNTLYANHIPPAVPETDKVYQLLRKGGCFRNTQEECDNEHYNNVIGYTKELATSGLDIQVQAFMSAAKSFMDNGTFSMTSPYYQLLDILQDNFQTFFAHVLDEYNNSADSKASKETSIMFALMALSILSFGAFSYVGIF